MYLVKMSDVKPKLAHRRDLIMKIMDIKGWDMSADNEEIYIAKNEFASFEHNMRYFSTKHDVKTVFRAFNQTTREVCESVHLRLVYKIARSWMRQGDKVELWRGVLQDVGLNKFNFIEYRFTGVNKIDVI